MSGAPFAPWVLRGESVAGLARRPRPRTHLPDGLIPLPGPCAVVASRYTDSPVGPFLELVVAEPARLGLRLGWCVTTHVVDQQGARVGHRLNWGYPSEVGRLRWLADDRHRSLVWEDRDLTVTAHGRGPHVPWFTPGRSVQHRGDGPVVVPARARGLVRAASVTVTVDEADELAALRGRHVGSTVRGVHRVIGEARQPVGIAATLRAPPQAPQPVLSEVWRRSA